MKILDFNQWLLVEDSKNDLIPEIRKKNHLAIFIFGPPASGKSTFVKQEILRKNPVFKTFNPDDVSLVFTKDHNVHKKGASTLTVKYLKSFSNSGQNIIWDMTGNNILLIKDIKKILEDKGYEILFIHLSSEKAFGLKRNQQRERKEPKDYVEKSYEALPKNIAEYREINPNNYYLIWREEDNSLVYFKNKNGQWKKIGHSYERSWK